MEVYNTATKISCLTVLFIYYVTGVVGNVLIIWTILRLKYLRSIQNIIVAFLAVTDLLIVGCLLPMNMKVLISNTEPSFEHCRLHAIVMVFLFMQSVEFIMLISISRYVKICYNVMFKTIMSARNLTFYIIFFCVVNALFSSALWFKDNWWIFDKQLHSCVYNRYNSSNVSIAFMATSIGVPFIVTFFCYFKIYCKVMKSRKQIHSYHSNGLTRRRFAYENMVTKTQFAVFAMYIILYIPLGITSYGQRSDFPEAFHTASFYLCYLNSCINSFLYGFLNKDMRKGYLDSLSFTNRNKTLQIRVVPSISGQEGATNCTTATNIATNCTSTTNIATNSTNM